MQRSKPAPVRQKHLFSFLGLQIIPTNVNDLLIQPYTPNKTHLCWNLLKKLIYFLQMLWFVVDWRPPSGTFRPETLFFDEIRVRTPTS